jgi:hypothetical protein
MENASIKTLIVFTKIIGDKNGISSICFLMMCQKIPIVLQNAINQLNGYLEENRT